MASLYCSRPANTNVVQVGLREGQHTLLIEQVAVGIDRHAVLPQRFVHRIGQGGVQPHRGQGKPAYDIEQQSTLTRAVFKNHLGICILTFAR